MLASSPSPGLNPAGVTVRKLLCCIVLLVLCPVADAEAGWGPFRLGFAGETSHVVFDELTEFTGFVQGASGQPDRAEFLRYELEDTPMHGFGVHLELGEEFRLSWSRQTGKTRLAAIRDGVDIQDNPNSDPPITIPAIDLRVDLISLSYHPRVLHWRGLAPYLRAGYGWILTRQDRPFRPTTDRLPLDYGDSDGTTEVTLGLEWRWRFVRVGGELRTLHWRWNPEDPRTPERTTHALAPVAWLGLSL